MAQRRTHCVLDSQRATLLARALAMALEFRSMIMGDSKWARLFHLCAENQWHWKVRFVNDTRPYNEVIYEPMAVGRIAATTIRDGFEGPFYYKELVWVRVPNAVVPGACVGVRKLITIDLVKVAKAFQESGIPFTSSKEYVHVGQPEL